MFLLYFRDAFDMAPRHLCFCKIWLIFLTVCQKVVGDTKRTNSTRTWTKIWIIVWIMAQLWIMVSMIKNLVESWRIVEDFPSRWRVGSSIFRRARGPRPGLGTRVTWPWPGLGTQVPARQECFDGSLKLSINDEFNSQWEEIHWITNQILEFKCFEKR